MIANTAWLAAIFAQCSLLAVGGVTSSLPEMERQVTEVHHWMSAPEFAALFALAQAAPGPNMLVATLVGWRVAGLPGALAATLAIIGPSSLLTYGGTRLWHRFRDAPWRAALQAGLTPVTAGLITASALLLAAATSRDVAALCVTLAVAAAALATPVHPLLLLGAGALLGLLGWV